MRRIQIAKMPMWMKRKGRLPENSAIQSATFMTVERLSTISSLAFRVAALRMTIAL